MTKVLVVEDNEMNRDMLSRRLMRRGFHVIFAVDGEQGVDLARSERPDIILMDMSLPVIDVGRRPGASNQMTRRAACR
jgi:two-component system, cell cycle response regulator DivK